MKKIIWVVVSCVMALSLVLASCGEAEEEEEEEVTPPGEEEEVTEGQPIYGGTITTAMNSDYMGYDPTKLIAIYVGHMQFTSNELLQGDWTKGPQGTHETDWEWGFLKDVSLETGELAGCGVIR